MTDAPRALVLSDWDNTLRRGFSMGAWLAFLDAHRHIPPSGLTAYHSLHGALKRGDFSYDLFLGEVGMLYRTAVRGIHTDQLRRLAQEFVVGDRRNLYPFSRPLLQLLQRLNAQVLLVSGAPEVVLSAYSRQLPLTLADLGVPADSGGPEPGTTQSKSDIVDRLPRAEFEVVVAIGDTSSDRALFDAARLQIIVNNPDLAREYPEAFHLLPDDHHQVHLVQTWLETSW